MHVALNDESEYAGGRLVFATAAGFEMPPRPAGSECTHTFAVVHANDKPPLHDMLCFALPRSSPSCRPGQACGQQQPPQPSAPRS
jgi:hypothetical protein